MKLLNESASARANSSQLEMGTSQSSTQPSPEEVAQQRERSRHVMAFKRLYGELSAPDHSGQPATRDIFKNRFENYFGGPYLELGTLLYKCLLAHVTGVVDEETFISTMTRLERVSGHHGDHQEADSFYFSVFAEGKDTLDEKALTDLIHVCATFAMVVGSELHDQAVLPRDHFIIQAMLQSAWQMTVSSHELSKKEFDTWVASHCPRLTEGIQHWIHSLLLTTPHMLERAEQGAGHAEEGEAPHSSGATALHLYYHLPTPSLSEQDKPRRGVELQTIIWALSTSLPLIYLGHREDGKKHTKPKHNYPIGGVWTLLYSSSEHGFSMNRFQHHCSDYREPSVMLLTCRSSGQEGREEGEKEEGGRREAEEYLFAIAVDTDWRDGTYFWGGEKFYFLQLQPSFLFLTSGPKQISLNEKKRGFPTGLRVMSSDGSGTCLLEVDSALETARYDGQEMKVGRVEVWGCGGEQAAESQKRMKQWEKKEILRRRKIKASEVKEMWMDSPDRYLLELGGVKTTRPTEQQQQ